jgi:RNA-splicing ligase RtcB
MIDRIENEKLEQEAQQEQAVNIVANEAIVNNSADFSSTPDGGIAVGGLELDPITQQLLED